jgi:hypothetical protein
LEYCFEAIEGKHIAALNCPPFAEVTTENLFGDTNNFSAENIMYSVMAFYQVTGSETYELEFKGPC